MDAPETCSDPAQDVVRERGRPASVVAAAVVFRAINDSHRCAGARAPGLERAGFLSWISGAHLAQHVAPVADSFSDLGFAPQVRPFPEFALGAVRARRRGPRGGAADDEDLLVEARTTGRMLSL